MKPVVYTTLYAGYGSSPYIAMVILNIISVRIRNGDIPYVVFDYSQNREVADRLEAWQKLLSFDVRPLVHEDLERPYDIQDIWHLMFDALLHVSPEDPIGETFVFSDADAVFLDDPVELAKGDFAYRLPHRPSARFAICSWLACFNLSRPETRRLLALTYSLKQPAHRWQPWEHMTSRKLGIPTSESCLEVAIQLLGRDGFEPILFSTADRYQLHYAHHNKHQFDSMLELLNVLLTKSPWRDRYYEEFGSLRAIMYRENTLFRTIEADKRRAVV